MPKKSLEWSTYRVPVSRDSVFRQQQRASRGVGRSAAPRTEALAALPDEAGPVQPAVEDASAEEMTADIPLPDLSGFADAVAKARVLLETAAEIEHALMVQYLYAAYSLKDAKNVQEVANLTPSQRKAITKWMLGLLEIAREEMGHLMTVQNLLLLIGAAPNFEREDFPPTVDIYPFTLHLEPMTQRSLAKYVVAESPTETSGLEDIIALAVEHAHMPINHVGVLYALLGLVFATEEQVVNGGSGSPAWDEAVREVARAAYLQNPDRSAWHLRAEHFHPEHASRQGDPEHWTNGADQVRVHRVTTRDEARNALRDVGEQGEGPGNASQLSHFERFTQMYRGTTTGEPFPAQGGWIPTRAVSTDPRTNAMTDARARRWAELFDARYAFMLGILEHYLMTTDQTRLLLVGWIFAEMRTRIAHIARHLTILPIGTPGGVAAPTFTMPSIAHLPGDEPARWIVHRDRVQATLTIVAALRADPADRDDEFIVTLQDSEQSRLVYIEERLAGRDPGLSFARDIRPMFRFTNDIPHMRRYGLDLADRASVAGMVDPIIQRLRGLDSSGQIMPPPPSAPWTIGQIQLFELWVAQQMPA